MKFCISMAIRENFVTIAIDVVGKTTMSLIAVLHRTLVHSRTISVQVRCRHQFTSKSVVDQEIEG